MTKRNNSQFSILNSQFGFTLIELMVAMAIIAILVMVGYASYIRSQRRALDVRRQGDMKAFQNAMEQYMAVNQEYPDTDALRNDLFANKTLPTDPINNVEYFYNYSDLDPNTYCACAKLVTFDGNAYDGACTYAGAGDKDYFCVENLQ